VGRVLGATVLWREVFMLPVSAGPVKPLTLRYSLPHWYSYTLYQRILSLVL